MRKYGLWVFFFLNVGIKPEKIFVDVEVYKV